MQYITGIEAYDNAEKTAVTLGKFDGLHRGHQKLVNKIKEYEKEGCRSVLCAFDMDRDSLLTHEERREKLEGQIDCLIRYPFTPELRRMEAEDFIHEILYKKLHAVHVVIGTDFTFGYQKKGNAEFLCRYAEKYGYTVDVIEKEKYGDRAISSSYIREALEVGNVRLAERLLGYPYEMTGIVEHGRQLGRTLGFPTMNIEPRGRKILPRFGVYACQAWIDGKWYPGIGNAGIKPTVTEDNKKLLEVYVYGYEGDAYGEEITVRFCEFERPETKFSNVEELKKHVMNDMEFGRNYFKL